jgi:hypothetical protein
MVPIAADPNITKANIGSFEISPVLLRTLDSFEAALAECTYRFENTAFIFLLVIVTPFTIYLEQENEYARVLVKLFQYYFIEIVNLRLI